ncbi:MAG: ribosome maturation factor RimM [Terracidiphilus sp.]|jgi:16S rRNA processing protein RimM
MAADASGSPRETATTPEDWTWLARIRRPQGRKGEVLADLLTDFPERFSERRRLWLLTERAHQKSANSEAACIARETELISYWPHKGGIVLHFAGAESISAAEALKGLIVAIPRAERAALDEDEVYIGDLIGCTLVDVAGAAPLTVGIIDNVDRSAGPVALLVVQGAADEILVPFAKSYLRRIDLEGKQVEMALPEGLVDLNAPGEKL